MRLLTFGSRRSATAKIGLALVVAIAATAGGIYAAYGSAPPKHRLILHRLRHATLRPGGVPVTFSRRAEVVLRRIGATSPSFLIATRTGRSFYRWTKLHGQTCFGSGPRPSNPQSGFTLGVAMCSKEFPSVALPVLDLSVYDWPRGGGPPHAYRLEGIAVDEVAAINYLDTGGATVASVPVTHNIYRTTNIPNKALSEVVAVDVDGNAVWASPLDR